MNILDQRADSLTAKATLVNVALEKRNAQLIVGSDGDGLKKLVTKAMKRQDALLLKIIRNVAQHEGVIQEHMTVSGWFW